MTHLVHRCYVTGTGGIDPNHRDNAGLRKLIRHRELLIYFHEVTIAFQVPLAEVTRQRLCAIRLLF